MNATIDQLTELCRELHHVGEQCTDEATRMKLVVLNLELLLLIREVEGDLIPERDGKP